MTNAVVMRPVLAFNRSAIEAKIARAARFAGVTTAADDAEAFDAFVDRIGEMGSAMDVPANLVDQGVDPSRVAEIAAAAVEDPSASGNPIPFDLDAATEVFNTACAGA